MLPIRLEGYGERGDRGHRTCATLLFHDGDKPAAFEGCFVGVDCGGAPWHAVRLVRGLRGRVTHAQFFDRDKQLIRTDDCSVKRCFK